MEALKKKLENFWYYNKWKTVAFAVILISVILCVSQCSSREKNDYTFVLFAYNEYAPEQLKVMGKYFAEYGEDLNGDGKISVGFNDCSYDRDATTKDIWESRVGRLQASIIAEKNQVIFVTDEKSFEFLDGLFDGAELFADVGLPDNSGKAYILPDEFYEKTESNELKFKSGLRVSIRKTEEKSAVYNSSLKLLENMSGIKK